MKNENLFDFDGKQSYHASWRAISEAKESDKREICNNLYSKFKNFSDNDFKKNLS